MSAWHASVSLVTLVILVLAPTAAAADPSKAAATEHPPASETTSAVPIRDIETNLQAGPQRRFMIGIEAVGMQVPPLRSTVVKIDRRTVGDTATLGGVGLFFRFRPTDPVGVDATIRSGSLRYVDTSRASDSVISQDVVSADIGTIFYLARGEMGGVGVDAGLGGIYNRVGYALGEDPASSESFGSFMARVGFNVELVTTRVAFVFAVRSLGVITPRGGSTQEGPAFQGATTAKRRPPPSPTFQTFVVGSAGIAYRF
ncbi:MAG: hypothetical protein V3V08_08530 [Nannocystaceae bacterium]